MLLEEVNISVMDHGERPATNDECLVDLYQITTKWPIALADSALGKQPHINLDNTLSEVSLTVKPGQLMAVVGPLGSGKVYPQIILYSLTQQFNFLFAFRVHC